MPKGEKILSPKQKDRTTNFKNFRNEDLFGFHKCLFFNWFDIFHWYLCHDNISIDILILRKQISSGIVLKLQLVSCNDNLFKLICVKIDFQN
jgi:hypothetical protein